MTADPAELGALYAQGAPIVLRRARALLRDEEEAREVVQVVFLRLLDRPGLLDGVADPVGWLYTSTTRACLNRLRDGANRRRLLDERVVPLRPSISLPRAENRVAVAELIAALPPPLDQVAVYAWIDGLRRGEIAELLDCSDRHASRLIERTRAALRALVAEPPARSVP